MKRTSQQGRQNAGKDWLSNPVYYRNQRIVFQKNTVSNDEFDNRVQSWTDYFEAWAYANTRQSSETNGDIPQEQLPIIFETRYCPELMEVTSTDFRIVFNGEYFDILNVDKMNYQHDTLKFNCARMNQHLQPSDEPGTSDSSTATGGDTNG